MEEKKLIEELQCLSDKINYFSIRVDQLYAKIDELYKILLKVNKGITNQVNKKNEEKVDMASVLNIPLNVYKDELDIRSYGALIDGGFRTVGDLAKASTKDIWKIPGAGKRTVLNLELFLKGLGLSFGMNVDSYLSKENKDNK